MWIVGARGQYYATVQIAEGEPDPPVVVPVEVIGLSRVKFTIGMPLVYGDGRPAPDSVVNFDGTATRSGLSGTINSEALFNLKRRNSHWQ